MAVEIQNFIGGQFLPAVQGGRVSSFDPRTEEVALYLPDSGPEDVNRAVEEAVRAQPGWSGMGPAGRCAILEKVADMIEARSLELAQAESRDQGKPLWLAKETDIPRAVLNFRHFAANAKRDEQEAEGAYVSEGVLDYCTRSPVGVVAVITPWNLPLYLLSFKIAPALAYGNSVVAKPSEFTSLTAHHLAAIFKEAGLPDGVVNIVYGTGPRVGPTLCQHPMVNAISFTGSTATGLTVSRAASVASYPKKLSLEMGGKNAALVFSDADLDLAVEALTRASFVNSGQVCLSSSRIFVQSDIFEAFKNKFVQKARSLRVGPDPEDYLGPLVSEQHFQKVLFYLDLAKQEGATFLCGEDKIRNKDQKGYYVSPTVLTGLPDKSRCMQEEIFGPVTCLTPFLSEGEVLRRADDVPYGLSASVFTTDLGKAHRVASKLKVGTVWINAWLVRNLHLPFGGWKASGLGAEGTRESRDFCTKLRTVSVKYS